MNRAKEDEKTEKTEEAHALEDNLKCHFMICHSELQKVIYPQLQIKEISRNVENFV